MAQRSNIFRTALQVSARRVGELDDIGLGVLMLRLMRAQAYRCALPRGSIIVNSEETAKDDGCDGWTDSPAAHDEWLGSTDTCWQFKAGGAGAPSRLKGEVRKFIPAVTLADGGRLVVVASGSSNGVKGENDRRTVLAQEAKLARIPHKRICVVGSERLANWCNEHPAVAADLAGRPSGLWTLEDWSNSDEHQSPWHSTPEIQGTLQSQQANLDFAQGEVHHLHIFGQPGVGKTRFALELCRSADWRSTVVYVRQAEDLRLIELIDSAIADQGVRLMVVADEVQPEQLRPLRDSIGRGNGRVRLISIGHSDSPDQTRIRTLRVAPLTTQSAREVISSMHPSMPREHVDFVVRFASGYVRLAKLTADAIAKDATLDARSLLERYDIRALLNGMFSSEDRRPLYVLAALVKVGWTEDMLVEGEAIARHFGHSWSEVQARVQRFHDQFGIAPRGGRYRYISPTPLGAYLALEAWSAMPDAMKSLPAALPSDAARDSYFERYQSIAGSPEAKAFARSQADFFFSIDAFFDESDVKRWVALVAADPEDLSARLKAILSGSSVEERKRIEGNARRELVWALVRLAWRTATFADATHALALLGEAENEDWSNNSSGEFVSRFQIVLGGTAVPYLERIAVLDELLARQSSTLKRLVVRALAGVSERHHTRTVSGLLATEVPEPEWQPASDIEYQQCVRAGLTRLTTLARQGDPEVRAEFLDALPKVSWLLEARPIRQDVADLLCALGEGYSDTREVIRRSVAGVLRTDRKIHKKLGSDDIQALEQLHSEFVGVDILSRLQQVIGPDSWDVEDRNGASELAKELLADLRVLGSVWAWLTSGEAGGAWEFGQALAEADTSASFADVLSALPDRGRDLRAVAGYVSAMRARLGDQWYSDWLLEANLPDTLAIGVVSGCGATEATVDYLVDVVRRSKTERVPVASLAYGRWQKEISRQSISRVLEAIREVRDEATALAILANRLKENKQEIADWQSFAMRLITSGQLIRGTHMTSYFWKEVAKRYVPTQAASIAESIIREQGDREAGTWFVEHSEALPVLKACIDEDAPSVWRALRRRLTDAKAAARFVIGFPSSVVVRMPWPEVRDWIAEEPEARAVTIAQMIPVNFEDPDDFALRLIAEFGKNRKLQAALFSQYISGSWSGPTSAHWLELAARLEQTALGSPEQKVREWAKTSIAKLTRMAEGEREREDEENI